ncbi:MAG: TPM domain-containing protein [Leptospirales bacterium]|nr:TPM domain-containing protein [Leptospirales bacterium]
MKANVGFLFLLAFLLTPLSAQEIQLPEVRGRITDLTQTLSSAELEAIETKLSALEKSKGAQVAVLILPTTGAETIEAFSIRVAEKWKIGRKGVDDGVILIVAKDDRKLRIEVGYGLEGALPDATCKQIIDEQIVPHFKAGKFDVGINSGLDAIIKRINGEPLPPPVSGSDDFENMGWAGKLGIIAFLAVFIIVGTLVPMFVHKLLAIVPPLVGGTAAVIVYMLSGIWFLALFAAAWLTFFVGVVCTVLGGGILSLFGVKGVSSGTSGSGWRSSGSSSSSGFSGGGGSFGGGGSSGSW